MREFLIQLLEAGKTKDKAVKQCQEDAGRRDIGIRAGIPHAAGMLAQGEPLIEPSRKRRQRVSSIFYP